MKSLSFDRETIQVPDSASIIKPPKYITGSYNDLVCKAIDNPLDKKPLSQWDYKGKKVAIIVDDWGRPTPVHEFLPSVLDRISGAADITVITASGMHTPMNDKDLERKVGKDVMCRVRCISHDAGDIYNTKFVGITPQGNPVWINKYVAEADYKLAFGRIYPHSNYGYEGGYKMIVPGIASFETILRDHSSNFSDMSNYGIVRNNPSRDEADSMGRMVGIDLCVNIVVDHEAKPVTAFGGSVEKVFPVGIDFGQRNVWGSLLDKPADITLISGSVQGKERYLNNPISNLGFAFSVTREKGVVIAKADYKLREHYLIDGYDLGSMPIDELLRLHEKRNWAKDPREIQHVIKSIRGAFYERRTLELHKQKLYLASKSYPIAVLEKWKAKSFASTADALKAALADYSDPYVVIIEDIENTVPLLEYDFPSN